MNHFHAAIDAHVAQVLDELRAMAEKAAIELKLKAEHYNRSAGQKRRRHSKENAK